MIKKQIQEFSDILTDTMVAGIRHKNFADLTGLVRQKQALSLTRQFLPAAYLSIYDTLLKNKVLFLLRLNSKIIFI